MSKRNWHGKFARRGHMVLSRELVSSAIEDSCGVRRLAAQRLGITERHLYRLLKKHNIK